MGTDLIPDFIRDHYEVHEWKHACAILAQDFPAEWRDICALLTQFRLQKRWLTEGGGNKSPISTSIDSFLYARGWLEKQVDTEIVIITRCDELQQVFKDIGRAGSFGASTTHMSKLLPRINGGGGGGCPLLVFGITQKLLEGSPA